MLRRRSVLRGVVQGVGFRPHVARVAGRFSVSGFCGNDDESVFIEAQGDAPEVEAFLAAVRAELPPLALVAAVHEVEVAPIEGDSGFRIVASRRAAGRLTLIPPDIAPCDDCLAELTDPADRRFGYPFISCTNCGPRFSIIRDVPYDRPLTTLADFAMCDICAAEYADPLDRRFHAQPISCFDCGPRLWLQDAGVAGPAGEWGSWQEAIDGARAVIHAGGIVAVKGVGGYALCCDARNEAAVARLRERKHRPGKPLAVMAASAATAESFARFTIEQRHELLSPQRPIVLARLRDHADLAPSVAPGLADIGVLLPSSPLHELLLAEGDVFVATSGNRAGEPLTYRDADAVRDLGDIADVLLMHDRGIHVPVEDSVLMADGDGLMPVRRSRGYAPLPIALGESAGTVLAVGGEVKNTFAITRDGLAFVSAHIGDMGSLACQRAFETSVAQMTTAHRREPDLVVADLHPSYATTAWAQRYGERTGTPVAQVQHHHAHALSLLAEHGELGTPAVCAVFDGTGYGADGTVWGGEILGLATGQEADALEVARLWHLPVFPLPGGDSAVRHPWKVAVALLDAWGIDDAGLPPVLAAPPAELALVRSQLRHGTAVVRSSSAGRLFDAVASLLDVRHHVTYEAQAAMELERLAGGCAHAEHARSRYDDVVQLIASIVAGARAGEPAPCLARRFHAGLASITAVALIAAADAACTRLVGLSGGVFQNRMLVHDLRERLVGLPLRLLEHRIVPANDGGLSLGQAAAGHLMLTTEGR